MFYLRRLDGGLFTLQTVDYILAWIAMEDDGVCLILTTFKRLKLTVTCRFLPTYDKCSTAKTNRSKISSRPFKYTETTSTKMILPRKERWRKKRFYNISSISWMHAS